MTGESTIISPFRPGSPFQVTMSPDRGVESVSPTSVPRLDESMAEVPEQPLEISNRNTSEANASGEAGSDINVRPKRASQSTIPRVEVNENKRRSSTRSTSLHSDASSQQSRRDSGYSSAKSSRKQTKQPSRSSSKHSLYSGADQSVSEQGTKKPRPRRAISYSRMQQPPRANIDEAMALHERSLKLFASNPPPLPEPSLLQRSLSSPQERPHTSPRPAPPHRTRTTPAMTVEDPSPAPLDEDFVPATIIHWTSDETRRMEYAKIDKSRRGIRGLWTKLFPFLRSNQSRFYEEKEGSDAGSVRRFRLDLPDQISCNEKKKGRI
jgi:hypothetical protein